MNAEEHLRQIVGDLVVSIARLSAEIDTLKAQVAAKPATGALRPLPETSDNESGVSP